MLSGSSCSEHGGSTFCRHGYSTLPAYGADLTHRVIPTEQDKSIPLHPTRRERFIARGTHGGADSRSGRKRRLLCNGADTGCDGYAGNITGRESEQTSLRCFTRRDLENCWT